MINRYIKYVTSNTGSIVILSFFAFINCGPQIIRPQLATISDKPQWIKTLPRDEAYYYGVGFSEYQNNEQQTRENSIVNAVNEIALQLYTDIETQYTDSVIEQFGWEISSFKKYLKVSTKAKVKEWEIVSTWRNPIDGEFYTLARLSKKILEEQKNKERQTIQTILFNDLSNADINIANNEVKSALSNLLSGLYHIKLLFGESLVVEYPAYSGIKVNIEPALSERLRNILNNIYLYTIEKPGTLIGGLSSKENTVIKCFYHSDFGEDADLSNIPLIVRFEGTHGFRDTTIMTDKFGLAAFTIGKTNPFAKSLAISVSIDFQNIYFDKFDNTELPSVDFSMIVQSPVESIQIPVRPIKFFLISRESIDGNIVPTSKQLTSISLQDGLVQSINATFVDSKIKADYLIDLVVDVRYYSSKEIGKNKLITYQAIPSFTIKSPITEEKLFTFFIEPPIKEFGTNNDESSERTLRLTALKAKSDMVKQILRYFYVQE